MIGLQSTPCRTYIIQFHHGVELTSKVLKFGIVCERQMLIVILQIHAIWLSAVENCAEGVRCHRFETLYFLEAHDCFPPGCAQAPVTCKEIFLRWLYQCR